MTKRYKINQELFDAVFGSDMFEFKDDIKDALFSCLEVTEVEEAVTVIESSESSNEEIFIRRNKLTIINLD